MLEKSFGLLYYLKQAKNQKDEKRYVYLRITVDGDRREISTKRQCIVNLDIPACLTMLFRAHETSDLC
jgi:hypothetical protein